MNWLTLQTKEQLQDVLDQSHQTSLQAVAIFKHSTRCSISQMVKTRLERSWNFNSENLPIYILHVVEDRPASNDVAALLNVKHESPQILLIKNGVCLYDSSHNDISVDDIKEVIQNL